MSLSTILLKTGVVPTSAETLVFAPSSTAPKKAAIVKSMRFTNTGSTTAKLRAWFLKAGGSSQSDLRRILPYDQPLPAGHTLIEDAELTLGSGDGIYLQLGNTGTVEFVFCGTERDVS